MKEKNKLDELIDDASFVMGTTSVGITMAGDTAKKSLERTNRQRLANKIGKLIKDLER